MPARGAIDRRPIDPALVVLAVVATVLAAVEGALISDHAPGDAAAVLLWYLALGVADVVVGVIAWHRRPSNRTGLLLCLAGLAIMSAALANTAVPVLALVGAATAELPIAVLLHLLLTFPTGQAGRGAIRAIVAAGYLVTVVPSVLQYSFDPSPMVIDVLRVAERPDLVRQIDRVQSGLGSLVMIAAAVVLHDRIRSIGNGSNQRRVLTAVSGYGFAVILFLPYSANVIGPAFDLSPVALFALQVAAMSPAPFVFASGVLFGGFGRSSALRELELWLTSTSISRAALRDRLAAALGDPSVELLFRRSEGSGFVDVDGADAPITELADDRVVLPLYGSSGVEAIVTWPAEANVAAADVADIGAVLALAMERDRLNRALVAANAGLRESRQRIVEYGDEERRRLARDLHDVLQSRLVLAALETGRIAAEYPITPDTRRALIALRSTLQQTTGELRRLVHGVMPALLVERGLAAAVEDLVFRVPLAVRLETRLPTEEIPAATAATAYFVLAEAISNTLKHAAATELRVRLTADGRVLELDVIDNGTGGAAPTGTGLRSLADRAEALGGVLELVSLPLCGTRVRVVLPCES